jgi:molecular chaperone HscB
MVDHFAVFGLPRRYRIERDQLEALHRELSWKVHPDRHAQASSGERLRAVQAMTALNDAYRVLRDPVKRAEHLLELHGLPIGEHDKVDQALLLDFLELREELEAAQGEAREALFGRMRARDQAARAAIAEGFGRFEDTADRGVLAVIKERLIELRYVHRYLEEHDESAAD